MPLLLLHLLKHTVNMNRLTTDKRCQIVRLLVEGMGINATCRTTGFSKVTVLRLLSELGAACAEFQYNHLVGLSCNHVQCDEIWSFVHCKEKNVPQDKIGEFGYGDVWVWNAVDSETKLIFSWHVGMRGAEDAKAFMFDVAGRVDGRFQLTTDGHKAYLRAVLDAFGTERIDYAMLVKKYGNDFSTPERMYSPAVCTGCEQKAIMGDPDPKKISTSYVERTNLTLRMGNRRFTRLTNAHSKKIENHEASIALHLMYYNFARPHQTLTKEAGAKTTPAMAAGVADHVWTIAEIVSLLENSK